MAWCAQKNLLWVQAQRHSELIHSSHQCQEELEDSLGLFVNAPTESKNKILKSAFLVGPWTPPQPTYICAWQHKGQGRNTSPSQDGDRDDGRDRLCCPAWDMPFQGPGTHLGPWNTGTYLGPVFQSPFLLRCSTGGYFAAVHRNLLHIHNWKDWNYCDLSFETSFASSACFHGAHGLAFWGTVT